MRESRTYGFVRGVPGDWHPYRDRRKEVSNFSARVVNSAESSSAPGSRMRAEVHAPGSMNTFGEDHLPGCKIRPPFLNTRRL
jgi:hypothetical protein